MHTRLRPHIALTSTSHFPDCLFRVSLGVLILECVTGKEAADIAASPSRTASMGASYLSSDVNVPDSDLARR